MLLLVPFGFAQQTVRDTPGQAALLTASLTSTTCPGSGCLTVATTNYAVATVTIHGTYAGATIAFNFSDDGGTTYYADTCTRVDVAGQETGEILPSNQTRAWDCGVYATTNFQVSLTAIGSGTAIIGVTLSASSIEPASTVASLGAGIQNSSDAVWTSATANNTAVSLVANTSNYTSILVTLIQGTTITGGAIVCEESIDNSNWIGVQGITIGTTTIMGPTYNLVASTNISFLFPLVAPYFRIRLSPAIVGTGSVTIEHATQSQSIASLLAGTESLAPGTNVIGSVRVLGNAGAAFDAAINAAPPANGVQDAGVAATALPTAYTATNLVPFMTDKFGRLVVVPNTVRDLVGSTGVQSTSATASTLIAAGAAGVFNDIISLTCTNESGTATIITISDNGTGGNLYKFNIPATAGAGFTANFPTPLPQGTAAALWDILNSAAVTLDCVVIYAKNK